MIKDSGFVSLHSETLRLQGAFDVMMRLREEWQASKVKVSGDNYIYMKALFDLALSSPENRKKFIERHTIRFKDHERDKKGKLINCKAYYED